MYLSQEYEYDELGSRDPAHLLIYEVAGKIHTHIDEAGRQGKKNDKERKA